MRVRRAKSASPAAPAPRTIDAYLAPLAPAPRAALETVRRAIRAAAPDAVECISYNVPGFRLGGRLLVAFAAAKDHCAIYTGAYPVRVLAAELAAYDTAKGTVRFPAERPLPAALVRKLVRARVAEYAAPRPRARKPAARR